MSNKKHIDRLFQEKLKDFEAKPNPKVWQNIQKEIATPEKEKKRIIPIWYKYVGVAAAFLLLFTVATTLYNSTPSESVVDIEPKDIQLKSNTNKENTNSKILTQDEINVVKETFENNTAVTSSNETTNSSNSKQIEEYTNKTTTKTAPYTNSNSVSTTTNKTTSSNNTPSVKNSKRQDYTTSTSSPSTYSSPLSGQKNNIKTATNPTNAVAIGSNSNIQKINNASDQSNEEEINNAMNAAKDQSFSTAITEASDKNEIVKDSIPTNALENAVVDAKNKSKKEKKENEPLNRWSVKANAAPIYYNTLSKGSHIDDQFIDNTKNGDINASYGVNVGYAINDKLKVRSGINSLNVGYETTNVIVYENLENSGRDTNVIKNLSVSSITANGEGLSVISAEKINENQVSSFLAQDFNTTNLKQQINYIEVPVELEYTVINNRIGINVIGGMSTFILGGNEVSTTLNGETTQIGEVNNINPVSFSTNLGLGMDYDISKALRFNLEPTFKYQMNAFNNTSGDFKPYLLGVYTGFSYKF